MSDIDAKLQTLAEQIGQRLFSELVTHLQDRQAVLAPEYLTAAQVAQLTGFTPKALESLRSRREGPPYLKVGASVRYRAADVRAWIENAGGVK